MCDRGSEIQGKERLVRKSISIGRSGETGYVASPRFLPFLLLTLIQGLEGQCLLLLQRTQVWFSYPHGVSKSSVTLVLKDLFSFGLHRHQARHIHTVKILHMFINSLRTDKPNQTAITNKASI